MRMAVSQLLKQEFIIIESWLLADPDSSHFLQRLQSLQASSFRNNSQIASELGSLIEQVILSGRDVDTLFSAIRETQIKQFGSLGYYLLASPNMDQLLESLVEIQSLLFLDCYQYSVEEYDSNIYLNQSAETTTHRQLISELHVAVIIQLLKLIIGPSGKPCTLYLPWKESECHFDFNKLQCGLVLFDSSNLKMMFNKKIFPKRLPNANKKIQKVLREEILVKKIESAESSPFIHKVYHYLEQLEDLGTVTLSKMSLFFGIEDFAFKEKLANESATFKTVVTGFRQTKALSLLAELDLSLDDIAVKLGFSDTRSFEYSFKSWYGQRPIKFRNHIKICSLNSPILDAEYIKQLPAAPGVCMDIIQLLNTDDYDTEELIGILKRDPVLTAKILGIANSALFGALSVTDLKQAVITVLGEQRVMSLAIAMLANNELVRGDVSFEFVNNVWTKSFCISWWAENLALKCNMPVQDILMAAQMSQIGLLVFEQLRPEEMKTLWPIMKDGKKLRGHLDQEVLTFGLNRFDAAGLLLAHWGLPGSLIGLITSVSQQVMGEKILDNYSNIFLVANLLGDRVGYQWSEVQLGSIHTLLNNKISKDDISELITKSSEAYPYWNQMAVEMTSAQL